MSIDPTTDSIVANFFLKKKRKETVDVDDTHYYIAYTPAYNILGISYWRRERHHPIITWRFSPDCNLSINTDRFTYDIGKPALAWRLEIMNSIIQRSHERFNTQLITVCEPHHFYTANSKRYDILDALNIELTVDHDTMRCEKCAKPVLVTPTYEQMKVLL